MKLTVQAAARQAGISEARLRTWERRYGVPSPARSGTGRRLYDDSDMALIRRMAGLVGSGVPAAQAADAAREARGGTAEAPAALPLHPAAGKLANAAGSFDGLSAYRTLQLVIEEMGWAQALAAVVFPAFGLVGHSWERADVSPANEHFLSELVRGELQVAFADLARPPAGAPLLLLACPEDERHDLGLLGLRLMIGQRGGRVLYLGTDLPIDALNAAVRDVRPAGVCLAGTTPNAVPAMSRAMRALIAAKTDAVLFVGGPAIANNAGEQIPATLLPEGLDEAADVVMASLEAESFRRERRR